MQRVASLGTADELGEILRDDRARLRFLERLRWPEGFCCARCGGHHQPTRPRPGVLVCSRCQWFATVTAGTFLRDARVPLERWFAVYWAIASGRLLPTDDGLRSFLGLADPAPQALSAAAVLAAVEREPLEGDIDLDGRVVEVAGRLELLLLAAEHQGDGIGRVRTRRTNTLDGATIRDFVQSAVAIGSTVHTDCWSNHFGLDQLPVVQRVHAGIGPHATGTVLPRLDALSGWLRRWFRHHRVVRREDVAVALDGFCLAFNRGRHLPTGTVFCHLLRAVLILAQAQRRERRKISGVSRVPTGARDHEDRESSEDDLASA